MAYPNKRIVNSKTGQSIRFIRTSRDTDGQLLEMEATFRPKSTRPVAHYHPIQQEDFTVKAGQLTVAIDGATRTLDPGDTLHLSPGTVHAMWNASANQTIVHWQVRPALRTEYLFETSFGLANEKGTASKPTPSVWQSTYLLGQYRTEFRLARPAWPVQRVLLGLLSPISRLLTRQTSYTKYLD